MTTAETFTLSPVNPVTLSRVAFPRFQHETNTEAPVNERQLIERAAARPWLARDVVDLHLQVTEMPGAFKTLNGLENLKAENNWWGNAHIARRRESRFADMHTPLNTAPSTRLWLTGYSHLLSVTPDAPDHYFTELVLKGFVDFKDEKQRQCGRIVEFGALLINEETRLQQLVLPKADAWHEPQPESTEVALADAMLSAMQVIAQRELSYAVVNS